MKIIIFLLPLLASCTSVTKQELYPVEKSSPIYKTATHLSTICFKSKEPQLAGDLIFNSSSVEWEAIWENDFNNFKSSLIDPLGGDLYSFEIDDHNFIKKEKTTHNSSIHSKNIKKLQDFLSSIGSKQLRSFICGEYAFRFKNKSDGLFLKVNSEEKKLDPLKFIEIIQNDRQFISISSIKVEHADIEVQSNISYEKQKNGESFIIDSKFYYGLFTNESPVKLKWTGYLSDKQVYPTQLNIKLNDNDFTIYLNDFK